MNHLCSKREKKKEEKSFCHFLLKTSGFAGILKVIYLVLVQIDKEKKSIPFPSALLSFLCQKPECWMEVRTMSNLPDNLPVLCHPVNRWFSSLVWFCKNSLQQQRVLVLPSYFIYNELENSCLDKSNFHFCIYITWNTGLHIIWPTHLEYQAGWEKYRNECQNILKCNSDS